MHIKAENGRGQDPLTGVPSPAIINVCDVDTGGGQTISVPVYFRQKKSPKKVL